MFKVKIDIIPVISAAPDNCSLFFEIIMKTKLETKKILALALPAFLTQASYTLTSMVDLMMIGSISPAAIAGVGVGGILFWNIAVLFGGPVMAMGYLCAQSYGSGNMNQFYKRASAAFLVSLIITVPIAFFNNPFSILLYRLLGTEEEVVKLGAMYFRFRLLGFPLEIASMGMEGMIKATGDTKRPMLIRFISHIINLFFNYSLIFGKFGFPRMETAGAGLATFISYVAAFFMFLIFISVTFKRPGKRFFLGLPDKASVVLVIREGVKIAGNELSGSLSFLVYTAIVASLGAASLAANEIGLNITSTAFLPAVGFGQAAMILIGQKIGAGDSKAAKKTGLEVHLYCGIFMLGMGALFYFAPYFIGGLYTKDTEVLNALVKMLRIAAFFQVFDGAQILFSFCLRGAGDTTYLFSANLIGSWAVFIPGVWILVNILKLDLIWAWTGMYTFMALLCLIYGIRFFLLKWDKIKAK